MLSKRLLTIANMVKKDMVVADIGCDHAFLPIYLVENNITNRVYASDNKIGPLNSAMHNISLHHLENSISLVLANGLDKLNEDVNCVIIAGMGAELIIELLEKSINRIKKLDELIIQSNTSIYKIREIVNKYHFSIIDEQIVFDNHKYYEIIKIIPKASKELNLEDIYLGPILKNSNNSHYFNYLLKRFDSLNNIAKKNEKILDSDEYKIINNYLKKY